MSARITHQDRGTPVVDPDLPVCKQIRVAHLNWNGLGLTFEAGFEVSVGVDEDPGTYVIYAGGLERDYHLYCVGIDEVRTVIDVLERSTDPRNDFTTIEKLVSAGAESYHVDRKMAVLDFEEFCEEMDARLDGPEPED